MIGPGNGNKGHYNVEDVKTKSSDYTMTNQDNTIFADGSTNTVDVSLDPNPTQGQRATVKCIDATFACRMLGNGNNIDDSSAAQNLALNVARTVEFDDLYGWGIVC